MRRGAFLLTALAVSVTPAWVQAQTGSSVIVNQAPKPAKPSPAPAKRPRAAAPADQAAPQITPFVLSEVRVEGSSISPALLAAAWRPFAGRTVDGAALTRLVDAVGEAESKGGIALYNVVAPDQDFAGGVVRLQVVEGHVSSVDIQGGEAKGATLVRAYGAKLTAERPLRRATLQRYVSLIRDIPGLNAELELKPGTDTGAEVLVATLKPRPVQFAAAVNNRGAALLGRTQVEGDVFFNSVLRPGDQTRLAIAVPTDIERFQYYAVSHATPLGTRGTTLQLGASYLRTRPQGSALTGHAEALNLQLTHPLIRSYVDNLYVTGALDGLNSSNALLGQTISSVRTRALRLGLAYSRETEKTALVGGVVVSQGLDGLGARVLDPAAAEVGFRKLNLKLAFNIEVAPQLVLRLDGAAQLSGDRLPAAEQFALGGEEFGRAYEAAAIVGDEGQAGSVELAWRPVKRLPAVLEGSELYAFADAGQVTFKSRFGLLPQTQGLASAGGGVRLTFGGHTLVGLEAAKALRDLDPFTAGGRGWRGVFTLKTVY
jgi:hemolysin activation/secretion protein